MRSRRRCTRAAVVATLALLAAGEALASEGGLVLFPTGKLIGALLALFVILILPINALVFRPIFAVLDAREDRIAGTRRRAEKLAAQAEETLARYQRSVREVREEAERDRKERLALARTESTAHTAEARAGAEREIERARAQVAADLAEARRSLRPRAEALAREAAARVLGRGLS